MPLRQEAQAEALVAAAYWPEGQAAQLPPPATTNFPATQATQAVAPVPDDSPAPQLVHTEPPDEFKKVPIAHFVQTAAFAAEYQPAVQLEL